MAKRRNPLSEKNVRLSFTRRIQKMAKTWQKIAEPAAKHSQQMWRAVASGYFDTGKRSHMINLLDRGVNTIVPFLVEGDPKVLVETKIPEYKPWAYTTQLALNHFLKQMKFAEKILIPAARNSMMSMAITRTSIIHHRNYERQEGVYRLGAPYVEVIDFANYIGDPTGKKREDFIIEGDIYRLPTDYAKEFFGEVSGGKIADQITPDNTLYSDWSPHEALDNNFDPQACSLRDFTTFMDVYLYDEGVILTILPEGKSSRIIRETEWEGPEGGPYDVLGYKYIPETPIALPPAWAWYDMDVTMNLLIEKMRQQAEAQKNIIAVESEEDAAKLRNVPNNGILTFEALTGLQQLSVGGVNDINFQWVSAVESEFARTGGNADVLGGRGAQAPTLGQEQMIYNNATRIVGNMYNRFSDFMQSVLRKMAWAFWIEPTTYVPVIKEVPGIGNVPVVFKDRNKVGQFYDFVFNLVPYSTQRELPETKYNKIMQFMTQWIMPTMQIAQSQGAQLDIPMVTSILSDYMGIDTFNQWYKTITPQGLGGLVNYKMLPDSMGQTNDSFGATEYSRNANKNQQQARAGGQSSPNNQEKQQ